MVWKPLDLIMNTLEQHNEEMSEKLQRHMSSNKSHDKQFYDDVHSTRSKPLNIEDFIKSQNKQLYIKIAEGEIERLNEFLEKRPQKLPSVSEREMLYVFEKLGYWQNILTELKK